ncbi:RND efflux system, outer membrane lipoprotein, NodT family [Gemmatirosa kalamazoonensis]|uniref:RND efflux system, outer membrane lipoprotein, NodT family n=1 Tax=Gemmatirosa kalamazoonensis TaxID=861299 RepID=W0RD34_9BACT|nr:TolC family protein [Gemmatirosa kalamazoonensis]AHG88215.1 RND efflux system, outer membrane lipoprotein, NodT family [Gemmatirosa kalamazoonensis]
MTPRIRLLLGGALLLGAAVAPAQAPTGGAERSPIAFWTSVRDTTLERLMNDALAASRDVRAAAARVRGARAARTAATFDFAPTVTASAGYTRQRLASPSFPGSRGSLPEQELWDAGLRMSWEVDVFGRVRRAVRARTALADAAGEDLRDVRVLLTAEVADAYFDLRGAQDRLAVARRNAENQRGTLDLTVQRLEGGRGTELDTERARAQLATTLAEVPTLEAAVDAARYRLGVLTARDASTLAIGDATASVTLPANVGVERTDSLVRAVVNRRPDVRSAEQQVAARSAFVGAARAEYLPRLSIGGASGYTSSGLGTLGNTGTPRFAIGPVISWPALDLGRVRAGVDAARADEEEAKAEYEGAVLRATGEVETALTAYRKARERLAQLDAAATASAKAAELARLRFTEGASDFLQVLDAERTLLEAQNRRAVGLADASTKLVTVYRALGGS